MGILYLISTPIGNLEDITIRALKAIWAVDILLCEDTRETQKILQHYKDYRKDTDPELVTYHDHNREQRIAEVISYLTQGKKVGLVSDRGTPLISDPGYKLVQQVIALSQKNPEIQLQSVPGVSAITTSLQLSGLPPDRFMFIGFLPRKSKARQDLFTGLPKITIIAFESPERLLSTFEDMNACLKDARISVCRELTKMHEEVFRGSVRQAQEYFSKNSVKGEITLVFHCSGAGL